MMISVIILPTHVPINVFHVIVKFTGIEEYSVETRTSNSILHYMVGLV